MTQIIRARETVDTVSLAFIVRSAQPSTHYLAGESPVGVSAKAPRS